MQCLTHHVVENLLEAKYGDENVSRSLRYCAERLKPEKAVQIVARLRNNYDQNGISVTTPEEYFGGKVAWV